MSWQDRKRPLLESIAKTVREIMSLRSQDLAGTTDDLGKKFSFESSVPLFEMILDFFRRFSTVDLSFLSAAKLNEVRDACVNIRSGFTDIRTVDLANANNPADIRDQLTRKLDESFSENLPLLGSILATVPPENLGLRKDEQTAKQIVAKIRDIETRTDASVEQIQRKMDEALASVQKAAARAGVTPNAVHFDEEANKHDRTSRKWFRGTVTLAVGAFLLTVGAFLHAACVLVPAEQVIQIAIAKVTALAVLYSAMIWAARIYRSERHNCVVNRHRCNALRTFQTFVSATNDDHTKNAVLLQATESIFGHQPSGFSDKSHDSGSPKILEVFRGLTSRTPSSE